MALIFLIRTQLAIPYRSIDGYTCIQMEIDETCIGAEQGASSIMKVSILDFSDQSDAISC